MAAGVWGGTQVVVGGMAARDGDGCGGGCAHGRVPVAAAAAAGAGTRARQSDGRDGGGIDVAIDSRDGGGGMVVPSLHYYLKD
jgi:hypothetical protein